MTDTGISVVRWRRYGKDRLYVKAAGDVDLGWWDLVTDEAHPADPGFLEDVTGAAAAWGQDHPREAKGADGDGVQPTPPTAPASTSPPQVALPWLDLSTNQPGEGIRDLAEAAQLAAPVRTMLARLVGAKTQERAWRIGADGEEKVATQLAKLGRKDARWRALHSIPVGSRGSDIDHLVIGPGGVFTINTKHHPGAAIWVGGNTFLVDGHHRPYVRNARHEAERASKLLTQACGFQVAVMGVIATVNAGEFVVRSQPVGVHVIPRRQVSRWLGRHGAALGGEQAELVYEVARRSTTWRT